MHTTVVTKYFAMTMILFYSACENVVWHFRKEFFLKWCKCKIHELYKRQQKTTKEEQ